MTIFNQPLKERLLEFQLFTNNKTKDEKFDARCQLKSINLYLGLREK